MQTSKKKRKFIYITAIILLMTGVLILYLMPSDKQIEYERIDYQLYLDYEKIEQAAAIVHQKMLYLSISFIEAQLDESIVVDEEAQAIIITKAEHVYEVPFEQVFYYENQQRKNFNHAPLWKKEDEFYISARFLEEVYPIEIKPSQESTALFVNQHGSKVKRGRIKNGTGQDERRLREGKALRTAYYSEIDEAETFYIRNGSGRYAAITTEAGQQGYLLRSAIEVIDERQVETGTKPVEWDRKLPFDDRFMMTWDAIYKKNDQMVDFSKLTGVDVVSPTWYSLIDEKGSIRSLASEEYVKSAHNRNVEVWALFSNSFDPVLTSEVIGSYQKRKYMIQQLLDSTDALQLDGINIDFENVYPSDGKWLTQFMREFVPLAHQQNLVVSIDVTFLSTSGQWSAFYERKALADIVDYMAVMAYDEHWANGPVAGSVASLPWVTRKLEEMLEIVPNERLVLGIPLYTRLWKENTENGRRKVTSEALTMKEAMKWIDENNLTPEYDPDTKQNVVRHEEREVVYTMWLEDEQSLERRAEVAAGYDLAGVAAWSQRFATAEAWEILDDNLKAQDKN